MKNYKILFTDLDGTLIDTLTGKTFPEGVWDMKLNFVLLDCIKKLNPLAVFIVSNQGGIEKGHVIRRHFNMKIDYITVAVSEYLQCYVNSFYCETNDPNDKFRKPNPGMLEHFLYQVQDTLFRNENITKDDCLMIGDASGKAGQFSDSDKMTAENFGCDYMDINDFIAEFSKNE